MITVIGLDGSPLSPLACERLAQATLVLGGQRHLGEVDVPAGIATVALRDDPSDTLRRVVEAPGDAVVLASGDPGLFGILRLLRAWLPAEAVQVLPARSCISLAFARAGLSWDDALVVSAHGRELRPALAVCRAHPKVAVLTAPGTGPREIGAALVGTTRRLFVAERLGLPGERCGWITPEQADQHWDELNVVLVVDDRRPVPAGRSWLAGRRQPVGWALPDDAFLHRDAMVTKAEVRAVALSKLGPRLGDTVWDIGAGSGSVGIECARLGAAVVAVEHGDTSFLEANIQAFDLDVQVVRGSAPGALRELPDPDAVFVGGGGQDIGAIVSVCVARAPRVIVVTLAVLHRVAAVQQALAAYDVDGTMLQANRMRRLAGETALAGTNPVLLVWGHRR